jgi:autotransporter translocation and assembly factor TamB
MDLQVEGFSAGGDEALDVTATLDGDATHVSAKGQLTASGKTSTWTAELPLARAAGRLGLDPERPLDVSLRLDHLPVGPFAPAHGPISYASGSVSGTLRARGTAAAPELDGRLTLNDVGFTATAIAQPLSDIKGELVLGDGKLLVESLSARDAGGELALQGELSIRSLQSVDGVFDLVARDFPLRQAGQVVATTSAKAKLSPSVRPKETTLRVEVTSFDTWLEGGKIQKGLALDKHPDLVVDGATDERETVTNVGEPRPRPRGEAPGPQKVVVNVKAGEGFRVRRGDFSMKLSTELSVTVAERGSGHEPKLTVDGRITFESGNLDMLGRTFDLEPGGTLRFSGPPVPIVALTASYVDRRSDDIVLARVSGSAASPKVEFSINEEKATPAEALQAIYGAPDSSAKDSEGVEGEAEVEAQQMLAALTAGILTAGLRKRFGGITPIIGFAPTAKEGAEQVRAGFELDTLIPSFLRGIVTGIYVEGSVSSEQEDDAAGAEDAQLETLIELRFPHDLVSIGRHGPGATWSLDLGWRPGPF